MSAQQTITALAAKIDILEEQNRELLDALRDLLDEYEMVEKRGSDEDVICKAKAAIAKAANA